MSENTCTYYKRRFVRPCVRARCLKNYRSIVRVQRMLFIHQACGNIRRDRSRALQTPSLQKSTLETLPVFFEFSELTRLEIPATRDALMNM